MRKLLIMFALMLGIVSANAQIATENSNALDNISLGVTVGASTPLDFNSVFPVNPNVGIRLQKDFTPAIGVQVEGLAILNDNHFSNIKTTVKATNVGINGALNLTNAFKGYQGAPRFFEVSAVAGIGWLHAWNASENSLTAKTGLDLAFNFGKTKAHSIVVTPAVYWNLNKFTEIKFDKRGSQLALNVSYVYHFKTSNGTHHFKTYDIGAMISEIDRLNGALAECENRPPKIVEKVVKVPVTVKGDEVVVENGKIVNNTAAVTDADGRKWVVTFETNSSRLSIEDMFILNQIDRSAVVDIVATASPVGSKKYNQSLSERRAKAVADHLSKRGVTINSAVGKGADATTGRSAIVTVLR